MTTNIPIYKNNGDDLVVQGYLLLECVKEAAHLNLYIRVTIVEAMKMALNKRNLWNTF